MNNYYTPSNGFCRELSISNDELLYVFSYVVLFQLSIHILCNESQPVPELCQVLIFSFFLIKKKDEEASEDAILVLFF